MKNKKRYKFITGVQQIVSDSPNKSKLYNYQTERAGEDYLINNSLNALSGQYKGIGQIGGMAGDFVKNKVEDKKTGSIVGGALKTGASGAALGAQIGSIIPGVGTGIGAAVGGTAGLIIGGRRGKQEAIESAELEKEAQQEADTANFNKGFKRDAATNVQQFVKKGRRKLKTKQPRLIETEGREPIFSPKKKDGTRDLLYYNPNDPTHEEGGVKALVMPRNKYNSGTSNLMPRRSKVSLLGSGNMAVGARQVKVNELNDISLSENLGGMPAVNAANKFIQPMAGKMQVARQIPEERRKEKQNTPRSHKKVNPDLNKIVDPPMLYEMKPPAPRSTFNTKNDFKKGGKYVKTYAEGTSSLEIKKFAPGGDKIKAKATPEEREAVRRIQRSLGVKADGWWGPITQKAWERKNNIAPKPDSTFTSEDEREARKLFNIDFARAEKERKADSTLYANRVVPTALNAARSNKKVYVTEKRPGRPDTGRKTGNNACLTGVCNVNKMTGTNLPFDMRIAANPNIKGDNPLETRFNPAFQKNSEKLGYKRLTANDKLQPGDVLQKSVAGISDHARLFLGNKKGPLIGEDHGNDDDLGFEVEDFNYLNKYNKVSDAMVGNPGLTAYRYMGLPKTKASMEIARAKVKSNKEAVAKKKAEQQQKQNIASTEITPSPEELEFMRNGSKYVKVYKNGSKSVSLAFSRGEKDPKGGLTQKGVDKYNRATGGNLKMAVTTPPSKLKPGSKAANRRKSFCARMSGVKGPMAKNGKPTRKALALRKWNC
jgi:gas vesicle protein/peptidoglycan hydrolase-like protein with peptidoglycan-binding domain